MYRDGLPVHFFNSVEYSEVADMQMGEVVGFNDYRNYRILGETGEDNITCSKTRRNADKQSLADRNEHRRKVYIRKENSRKDSIRKDNRKEIDNIKKCRRKERKSIRRDPSLFRSRLCDWTDRE